MSLYQQIVALIGEPADRWQQLACYGTACIFLILLCVCLLCIVKWVTKW